LAVLEYFGQFGSLNDIKIDNMKAQSKRKYEESEKELAIIAVSYGMVLMPFLKVWEQTI
jgi:dihydroxyacetone kinase-like predicted kinase